MKQPGVDLGLADAGERGVDGEEKFLPSRRRRIARAKARRLQAIGIAHTGQTDRKPDRMGRPTTDHAGAVERIDADSIESGRTRKQVHRQVIGVWPQG